MELVDILWVCCGNKKLSSSSQKGIVPETKKKAYLVAKGVSGEGDGYAFTVGGGLRVGEITLKVGGVVLDSVHIDSGVSCNLIDYNTWNNMKQIGSNANPKCRIRSYLRTERTNRSRS